MSTAGGPRLKGIGRGGDSDLVFCVDAHDARSYPGEPTSNIVPNPNFVDGTTINWQQQGTGATLTAVADSDNPANSPYILKLVRGSADAHVYTQLINKTFQGGSYTMSCWVKGDGTMKFGKYDNNSGWGSGGQLAVTLTDEWQLITLYTSINGSDTTTSIKFYICSDLAGDYVYLAGPQFELKTYATPYVWDGYNGRPATTNLMIHGNVGSGQSFSDSSPSKHTVAANGNVTHSATQSKFSGGSIFFDGAGDYLSVAEYLSGDWDFGSGDFTIDAWINLANISTYHVIAAQDDNSSNKSWQFRTNVTTGDLLFRYSTNGTNEIDFTATSGISINTWHHVAVCRYGSRGEGNNIGTLELFVDGKSKGTTNITNTAFHSAATGLTVGMRGDSTLPFEGYMDEFRITKGTALWRSNDSSNVKLMIHGNVGSGTTFEDSSASELALTNTNGVSHGGTSEFGGTALKFVRSSTQWIETASTDAADFGTGDWTVDYWFNMTNGQTDRMHSLSLGIYTGCGGGSNIDFNFNDGNGFWLYWNGCGSPNIIFGSDGDYGDGVWHHMAVTRESGTVRVWVDGVHKGSNAYSSSTSMGATTNVDIGASGGGVNWDGYLDEIRITKGTALWVGSGNFTPPTRRDTLSVFVPPTRRNSNGPVVDLSGHDNAGNFATTEMTDVITYRDGQVIEPVVSAVWDFDGTDDHIGINGCDLGTGGATLSCWFKNSTQQNNKYLMAQGLNLTGSNGFDLGFHTTPVIGVGSYCSIVGGGASSVFYAVNYYDNAVWHMLTTSYDGTKNRLYYDGELVATGGTAAGGINIESTNRLTIGSWVNTPASSFITGQVALARAYKVGLTSAQIKQNFNTQRSRFKV